MGDARRGHEPDRLRGSRSRVCLSAGGNHLLGAKDPEYLNATLQTACSNTRQHPLRQHNEREKATATPEHCGRTALCHRHGRTLKEAGHLHLGLVPTQREQKNELSSIMSYFQTKPTKSPLRYTKTSCFPLVVSHFQ